MNKFHWLRDDMRSGSGDEPPWAVGESRAATGNIQLCEHGYHWSPTLFAGLQYAPGPVACLVEVSDAVDQDETKGVSRTRKLLAAVNVRRELQLWVADCAEHVLPFYESVYPGDNRPRRAIVAARAFANGEIDAAAGAAAYAAGDAARAAAYAARSWQRARLDELVLPLLTAQVVAE